MRVVIAKTCLVQQQEKLRKKLTEIFAKSYIQCLKQVKGSQMSENWDEKVWQPTSTDTKSMLDAKFCPETICF